MTTLVNRKDGSSAVLGKGSSSANTAGGRVKAHLLEEMIHEEECVICTQGCDPVQHNPTGSIGRKGLPITETQQTRAQPYLGGIAILAITVCRYCVNCFHRVLFDNAPKDDAKPRRVCNQMLVKSNTAQHLGSASL